MRRDRVKASIGDVAIIKAQPEHCQYLYELHAKQSVMRALGAKVPIPAVDWRRMIQGVWDGWKDIWVIREGPFNVGHVGLFDRSDLDRRAEVTIVVDPARHRRGVARAALRLVIDLAENSFGLDLLIAKSRADNVASIFLFEGFGFKETGQIQRYYLEPEGAVTQTILTRFSRRVANGRTLPAPSKVQYLRPEAPFEKMPGKDKSR
jgi:putative acetyltransferase